PLQQCILLERNEISICCWKYQRAASGNRHNRVKSLRTPKQARRAGERTAAVGPEVLDDFVLAGGGLAEATHRERPQSSINLVQAHIELAVRRPKQTAALAVTLDQERPELLDLEPPERLGDPELEPLHVDDT